MNTSGEDVRPDILSAIVFSETFPAVWFSDCGQKDPTDGLGTGTIRKGYFRLRGIGTAKLMLTSDKGPYIYMRKRSGQYVVLNFGEADRTVRSYERISEMLDKTTSNDSVCLCE